MPLITGRSVDTTGDTNGPPMSPLLPHGCGEGGTEGVGVLTPDRTGVIEGTLGSGQLVKVDVVKKGTE